MKPHPLLLFITLASFGACKNHTPATIAKDTAKVVAKDTTSKQDGQGDPTKYVEQARLEVKDQAITLTTRFGVVDGKVDDQDRHGTSTTYFVYLNKKTGKADTIESGLDDLTSCPSCTFIIRDVTESFQLPFLVVQIVTPGEDIYYNNSFVAYKNGEFKKLFKIELDTREKGIVLHRAGAELAGHMAGRDEVVENLEWDYPVTVDTKTFEVTNDKPDRQFIGWPTTVTESFRAHRVVNGRVDSALVAVKMGDMVEVDTLYRTLGKVRLRLADSTMVEVKMETAKKKLGHNGAG
jgi:hypothetical protein